MSTTSQPPHIPLIYCVIPARKLYLNNTLSKHHRYVYDGMKLLATYNAKSSFAKINSFLWQPFGLDVPLIMTYNSTVYGYLVDANKNVLGLFNPSKTRVATYLYGPFGQVISSSGTIAANNPLQFSSEQFDADLNFVYYNFRYYFPNIGKWLTKDPIGEMGGWNLYAFCGNNAVNKWDNWGLREVTFKDPEYIESSVDPAVKKDAGSGVWASESPSITMYCLRAAFDEFYCFPYASIFISIYPDAFAHLRHYFDNTGSLYTIDFEKMISEVDDLREFMKRDIKHAMEFAQTLPPGHHDINSTSTKVMDTNDLREKNWFYAVGGYQVWGKGKVDVSEDGNCFKLEYELMFFDPYNWNKDFSANVMGITIEDNWMARFHKEGYAQEFDMTGHYCKTIEWHRTDLLNDRKLSLYDILSTNKIFDNGKKINRFNLFNTRIQGNTRR